MQWLCVALLAVALGHYAHSLRVSEALGRSLDFTFRMSIAITISIRKNETSVWTNGAKQNAFLMHQMYTHKNKYDVMLVNLDLGNIADAQADWGLGSGINVTIVDFDTLMRGPVHIAIESGMQFSREQLGQLHARHVPVASFRTGNDFFMVSECILYFQQGSNTFGTLGYDRIWTLPSYEETIPWQNVMFRAPVKMVPYVWSPLFFDVTAKALQHRTRYAPRKKEKTVAVFEPNLFIVKNFMVPLAIAELLYRQHPELLDMLFVTNADKFLSGSNSEFLGYVGAMDLIKDNKTAFVPRFKLPWFLSERVDVVLSHQWHNNLNFLYLDALYARYPLVHNSPWFKDCGYYYEGNDVHAGASALYKAMTSHDENIEAYNAQAEACLKRFSLFEPANLMGYEKLMGDLLTSLD